MQHTLLEVDGLGYETLMHTNAFDTIDRLGAKRITKALTPTLSEPNDRASDSTLFQLDHFVGTDLVGAEIPGKLVQSRVVAVDTGIDSCLTNCESNLSFRIVF